jgi:tetratricopeptide (TPR) repeat protein
MHKLKTALLPLACACFILTLGGRAAAQPQAGEADSSFDRAVGLHKAGDVAGAIREYRAILARSPGRVDVRSNLGAAYAQLGRYSEAVGEYQQALAADRGNTAVRFNLALAFYKGALFSEAAGELAQVAAAEPQNANAVLLLADCRLRLGEHKKVIELLAPLDAARADDRVLAYLLGTAFIQDKQFEKGQALIDRILRGGDSAEARAMLGAAHLMARDYQSALKEFERGLELNPRTPTLNALHGQALMYTGETERAAQAFRRELEINANDFEANIYLGILLKKEAKNDEALAYLQRAAQVRPLDLNARYHVAGIHLTSGKAAEAQRLLEAVVKDAPDFLEARVLLAQAYYRLRRKADGDREQEIIRKLNAERQAKQPGAKDDEGGAGPPAAPDNPHKQP